MVIRTRRVRAQIHTHMPQRHDVKAGPLASSRESPNAVSPKKSDWSSAAATRWRLTRRTGAGAPAPATNGHLRTTFALVVARDVNAVAGLAVGASALLSGPLFHRSRRGRGLGGLELRHKRLCGHIDEQAVRRRLAGRAAERHAGLAGGDKAAKPAAQAKA